MLRIVRWLVWLLISLVVVAGLDQTLLRVPLQVPVLAQFQDFYVDFRGRLFGLGGRHERKPSIEQVIETTRTQEAAPSEAAGPRYLYVDDAGALQFADSLEAVPPAYRREARPLER
jgi:hypothetical protein